MYGHMDIVIRTEDIFTVEFGVSVWVRASRFADRSFVKSANAFFICRSFLSNICYKVFFKFQEENLEFSFQFEFSTIILSYKE